jgi:hypothetical protein
MNDTDVFEILHEAGCGTPQPAVTPSCAPVDATYERLMAISKNVNRLPPGVIGISEPEVPIMVHEPEPEFPIDAEAPGRDGKVLSFLDYILRDKSGPYHDRDEVLARAYEIIREKNNLASTSKMATIDRDFLWAKQTVYAAKRANAIKLIHSMSVDVTPGSFILCLGQSGKGKSTLVQQIAAEHISLFDNKVVYLTNELSADSVLFSVFRKAKNFIQYLDTDGSYFNDPHSIRDMEEHIAKNFFVRSLVPVNGEDVKSATHYRQILQEIIPLGPRLIILDQLSNIELSESDEKARLSKWQILNGFARDLNNMCQTISFTGSKAPILFCLQQKKSANEKHQKEYDVKELMEGSKQTYNYAHAVLDIKNTKSGRQYVWRKVREDSVFCNGKQVYERHFDIPIFLKEHGILVPNTDANNDLSKIFDDAATPEGDNDAGK